MDGQSWLTPYAHSVSSVIEAVGILAIVVGALIATFYFLHDTLRTSHRDTDGRRIFKRYRQRLGRAILLGLEFLVAADIIGTVAVAPTFKNLGVLALIVLIRTFLSFSLEVEITGRWPWQGQQEE